MRTAAGWREVWILLRMLLGQVPGKWDGPLLRTGEAMKEFMRLSLEGGERDPAETLRYRTYAVWAEGLLRSLEELEESLFAARHFADKVRHTRWAQLSDEEKADYDRHVYFDKNAYIRMFALLDKLGNLLNHLLDLKTEKIKFHFSYYTVLRSLRESGLHPELTARLAALKDNHRDAMHRLRTRRNMEVHHMNAELQDDLNVNKSASAGDGIVGWLENLNANLKDAEDGWNMVLGSLGHTFRFACEWVRNTSR